MSPPALVYATSEYSGDIYGLRGAVEDALNVPAGCIVRQRDFYLDDPETRARSVECHGDLDPEGRSERHYRRERGPTQCSLSRQRLAHRATGEVPDPGGRHPSGQSEARRPFLRWERRDGHVRAGEFERTDEPIQLHSAVSQVAVGEQEHAGNAENAVDYALTDESHADVQSVALPDVAGKCEAAGPLASGLRRRAISGSVVHDDYLGHRRHTL